MCDDPICQRLQEQRAQHRDRLERRVERLTRVRSRQRQTIVRIASALQERDGVDAEAVMQEAVRDA